MSSKGLLTQSNSGDSDSEGAERSENPEKDEVRDEVLKRMLQTPPKPHKDMQDD
jgi:hypothetical protein